MRFGQEAIKLIILYKETLGISLEEAVIIIMKNRTAQLLLQEEMALSITGTNKNLSALVGITLLRDSYDFKTIKTNEKQLIYEYYNIHIGEENCLTKSKYLDRVRQKLDGDKQELIEEYVAFFERQNKVIRKLNNKNSTGLKAANLSYKASIKKS